MSIETVDDMLEPALRKMMANDAPNAAALDMPKVNGEASGLRRMHCMTTPATARPAPASTAPIILTMRMFQITLPCPLVSMVNRYLMTSAMEMDTGPL